MSKLGMAKVAVDSAVGRHGNGHPAYRKVGSDPMHVANGCTETRRGARKRASGRCRGDATSCRKDARPRRGPLAGLREFGMVYAFAAERRCEVAMDPVIPIADLQPIYS